MAELYPLATAAPLVKAALVSLLTTAFAADGNVTVSYGDPGHSITPDLVMVTDVEAEQEMATLRVNPSRDETLRVTVVISTYIGGGPEAQQPATERAYAIFAALADAVRADVTVGGSCRMAQVAEHVMTELDAADLDASTEGRIAGIAVTVAALARI